MSSSNLSSNVSEEDVVIAMDIQPASKSKIWNHFYKTTKTTKASGAQESGAKKSGAEPQVIHQCKYCSVSYSVDGKKNYGTSRELNHLRINHGDKIEDELKIIKKKPEKVQKTDVNFSVDEYRKLVLKWIVNDDQPFVSAQNKHFVNLVQYLNPNASPISNNTVKRDLMNEYDSQKEKLKVLLKEVQTKFSFSLDAWTSKNCLPFVATKIHWIDSEWKLCDSLLDFSILEGSHTGEALAQKFVESLDEMKIDIAKVLGVSMDNAANNKTMMDELKIIGNERGVAICNNNNRIKCLAHVINLVAQEFLEELKIGPQESNEDENIPEGEELVEEEVDADEELEESPIFDEPDSDNGCSLVIVKLRKLVKKIRQSPLLRQELLKICIAQNVKPLVPIIDVPTRWNSTFDMIKRGEFLRDPLSALSLKKKTLNSLILNENDWELLVKIQKLLCKFAEVTKIASTSTQPTIGKYIPTIDWLIERLRIFEKNSLDELSYAASMAREKIQKYKPKLDECEIPFIATILDPSMGFKHFKSYGYDATEQKKIREKFIAIFKKYNPDYDKNIQQNEEEEEDDSFRSTVGKRQKLNTNESDVDKILKLVPDISITDILGWWKLNEQKYRTLKIMAKDFLSVQAGSVDVEREFAGGVDLVTPTRCSMKGDTIQACMCLKSWWK